MPVFVGTGSVIVEPGGKVVYVDVDFASTVVGVGAGGGGWPLAETISVFVSSDCVVGAEVGAGILPQKPEIPSQLMLHVL